MTYGQLYHTDLSGKPVEACGTDSVIHLDGRIGLTRAFANVRHHAGSLNRNLGKHYTHFRIMRGRSYSDAWCLTPLMSL